MEEGMMKMSLAELEACAVFYDFKAAFPSVQHAFLLACLRHLEIPPHLLHFIDASHNQVVLFVIHMIYPIVHKTISFVIASVKVWTMHFPQHFWPGFNFYKK